uniref:Si:ch211-241e1.3 n=1 Tax=Poecilia latipinna TaxID=48699 RepID=A0A3B3VMR3_9TELE
RKQTTQKCSPGFYRKTGWLNLGRCLPCECNGLADECEDETGRCLSCKDNTAGDRCERCKDGYFGNAAQRTCRLCPCPFSVSSNSFAVSCGDVLGDIQCTCKPGYTGVRCENCAPGYYGDPLIPGGNCQPCNCNGNGNSCDPRTGECDNCAQTLLNDLEKLDFELARIKAQLDNASINLEKEIQKMLVKIKGRRKQKHSFPPDVVCHFSFISSCSGLLLTLWVLCYFEDLIFQLKNDGRGDSLPADSLTNILEKAQSMVTEMQNRNFTSQKTAAETELAEATKCKLPHAERPNEHNQKKIRSHLKDYNAKLKDLEKALEEARNLVKKANTQNGLNAQTLKNLEVIKQQFAHACSLTIAMAEDELKKTEDLVKMLSDSKTEFEALAAQLDGAKTDLTKKVNEITKAAAKKDLVEAAEEHAKKLSEMAKQIKDAMKNASKLPKVRDAKDAIGAYKNITEAIKAAEAAAKEAKDAADNALNELTFWKLFSFLDCKQRETHRQSQRTKGQEQCPVERRQEDLLKTIPSLNNKISEVENLTSGFSGLGNISENIMKIKELIEEARDAADKVRIAIPMKFSGEGHIELRPPKNLDDLKAYTTLSLSLQRPIGRGDGKRRRRQTGDITDMFVLYLGNRDSSKNYIGMVLRQNRLYALYKLNGQEKELESDLISTSNPQPATFDKVDLHRIYQDVELNLTKDITSGPPNKLPTFHRSERGEESKNLLKFSPDDVVFYVGGYPSNFTPPLSMRLPKYTGCIEFSTFNRKAVSLYNFQKAERINVQTPCKSESMFDSDYYEGTGYGRVAISEQPRTIDISVKTSVENALLFFTGDEVKDLCDVDTFSIQWDITTPPYKGCLKDLKVNSNFRPPDEPVGISKGCLPTEILLLLAVIENIVFFFVCFCFILSRPHFSLDVRTRSPEGLLFFAATRGGQSHLALYMSKGRIRLSVGKQREIFNREKYNDGKWHSVMFSLEKKKFRLIVDGIKAQDGQLTNSELKSMQQFLLPSKALPKQSVSGCVRNFKMNGALMLNPSSNYGAGPCFEGPTQKGVYFAGNGAHVIINDSFVFGSDLEVLFNIRPHSQTGLLLHVGDSTSHVNTMGHFLSIYMLGGEVVAHVNNGKGEYMTSVKPKTSLCDGIFHKISGETKLRIVLIPNTNIEPNVK